MERGATGQGHGILYVEKRMNSALGSRLSALWLAACFAALSFSQPLPPIPGAWTPGYQAPEPHYFSGTNARASGQGYTGGLVNG